MVTVAFPKVRIYFWTTISVASSHHLPILLSFLAFMILTSVAEFHAGFFLATSRIAKPGSGIESSTFAAPWCKGGINYQMMICLVWSMQVSSVPKICRGKSVGRHNDFFWYVYIYIYMYIYTWKYTHTFYVQHMIYDVWYIYIYPIIRYSIYI